VNLGAKFSATNNPEKVLSKSPQGHYRPTIQLALAAAEAPFGEVWVGVKAPAAMPVKSASFVTQGDDGLQELHAHAVQESWLFGLSLPAP